MKKLVLFVLSVMMLLPVMVNAQTTDVIVGTGTGTSYTAGFYGGGANAWVESIYDADDIQVAGYINSIAWSSATSNSTTTNTLKIYMGTTTRTTHSSSSDWQAKSGG